MSEVKPLPCIICGKELESTFERQPYGATTFYAPGQYGSTVFDPIGESAKLTINICDLCLVECSTEDKVDVVTKLIIPSEFSYEKWKDYDVQDNQIFFRGREGSD